MPTLEGRLGRWEVEHLHYWKDRGVMPAARQQLPLVGWRTKIATIGSCFAAHLARVLDGRGFTIGMHPAGIWYNTPSMAQELERIFGDSSLEDEPLWQTEEGRWVHPFKDYGRTFGSREELLQWSAQVDAQAHRLFSTAELVIVTLGLTEVWESTATGRVLVQIPPPDVFRRGIARFRPTNFGQNRANLERIYQTIKWHTNARMIFTVSPVPLYATFRDLDVRIANMISKSTLRAAVADLVSEHPDVLYFHSYEIATSLDRPQLMFETDGRHVRSAGVELIVDEFLRTFGDPSVVPPPADLDWLDERLAAPDPVVPASPLWRRIRRRLQRLTWRLGWRK